MLRQKWGSVVCPSCRNLVGVNDERCFTCGRWNPGLWGFAPLLSRLGRDLGFTQFVMWTCIILYLLTLAFDVQGVSTGGFNFLAPSGRSLFVFWGQRCDSGLSRRTMVDVFNRGVAPCRSFTHSLQYDVDPAAR